MPEIVWYDHALLVANKPAGMLAVPGRGVDKQDCLITRLQEAHPELLLVHRLDQATSGLMVFARHALMQKQLSALFSERQVHKSYAATVHGHLQPDVGTVKLPLMADWPNRPRQKVDEALGKPSETHWEVLRYDALSQTTEVNLMPVTGRTHQLRVHMLALGHPIVGDRLYGEMDAADRMLLHAQTLAFAHPDSGLWMAFRCSM